jgi:hypothetical protein
VQMWPGDHRRQGEPWRQGRHDQGLANRSHEAPIIGRAGACAAT